MSRKAYQIINLGLPRTGSSSLEAALTQLGFKTNAWVAQLVMQRCTDMRSIEFYLPHPVPVLVCSIRDKRAWLQSAQNYFGSRATFDQLNDLHYRWRQWVTTLERPVGFINVKGGYPELFKGLASAYKDVPLPHLQKGRKNPTLQTLGKIYGEPQRSV